MLNTTPLPERPAPLTPLDELRDRFVQHGALTLSDAELLTLLVRHTDTQAEVTALARRVLAKANHQLSRLGQLLPHDLAAVPGMTLTKAVTLGAALELGRRRREAGEPERIRCASSADAYELLRPKLADLPHEEFWLLMLDRGLRLQDQVRISSGGLHGTVADPKLIFKAALDRRTSAIILAHNHPSGQLRPSEEDMRLTKKLTEAGRLLEIAVQDHLIVTSSGYYSFADNGMM
jgi:DNA repair protein RadC